MGVFNELKFVKDRLPDGVEKLVKFKQDILLEAARKKNKISEAHFNIVEGGACLSYALMWIDQKLPRVCTRNGH
jgi:hypothetical protein